MFYVENIKDFRLNEEVRYSVKDSIRCRYFDCMLIFQADFIFLFKIIDKDVADNKICISKVDYFLNNNLIKNASENKAERKTIKKQYRVCIV